MSEPWREPSRVGEVLGAVGRRLGLANAVGTGRLWATWRDVVGDAVADHAEPTSLRGGVLRVRADSPAWATEVRYLREEIRQRVNVSLGERLVTEIRVWTGPGKTARRQPPGSVAAGERARLRAAPSDPREAFARARNAWARRAHVRR
jgi:predicted nucleic acid-binding Zn ribbon protein